MTASCAPDIGCEVLGLLRGVPDGEFHRAHEYEAPISAAPSFEQEYNLVEIERDDLPTGIALMRAMRPALEERGESRSTPGRYWAT